MDTRARITRHHMHPTSLGGTDHPLNIRHVPLESHVDFHRVYQNRVPVDCLVYMFNLMHPHPVEYIQAVPNPDVVSLVCEKPGEVVPITVDRFRTVLAGTKVDEAWRRLFGSCHLHQAVERWLIDWVPAGYFHQIRAVTNGRPYDFLNGYHQVTMPLIRTRRTAIHADDYEFRGEPIWTRHKSRHVRVHRKHMVPADNIPRWNWRVAQGRWEGDAP